MIRGERLIKYSDSWFSAKFVLANFKNSIKLKRKITFLVMGALCFIDLRKLFKF